MSRPFRTLAVFSALVASLGFVGCRTIYRPVYSPGKSHYKAPAPKAERSAADLLPPVPGPSTNTAAPVPAAPAPPAAPAVESGEPAIPGMPQ